MSRWTALLLAVALPASAQPLSPELLESDAVEQLEDEILIDDVPELESIDPEVAEVLESQARLDEDIDPLALPTGPGKSAVTPDRISLPTAEGSIEGMGESFEASLQSGAGTFGFPLAIPPGRNGVQPSFGLSYSSANGSGLAGMGWSFGAASIARQTDRGLPRYVDGSAWHPDEDRFVYNGSVELVPVDSAAAMLVDCGAPDCAPIPAELSGWQQYRAQIEGGFQRYFRSPDSTRWVVQSPNGWRYDFGLLPSGPSEAVDAAPNALTTSGAGGTGPIYRWAITRATDPHGSAIYYVYEEHGGRSYLSDVYYTSPHAACGGLGSVEARMSCPEPFSNWGNRVRFVYEPRTDILTSYASTWRVETAWRLRRVEMTAAIGAPGMRTLVRRYHVGYETDSYHSLISTIQLEGRPSLYDATLGVMVGDPFVSESSLSEDIVGDTLPPTRFHYAQQPGFGATGFGGVSDVIRRSGSSPPHSVDEARSDLFDVNSDGLPDLIVTDPARYRTAGGGPAVGVFFNGFEGRSPAGAAGTFSEAVQMAIPAGLAASLSLSNRNVVPMDADGDGRSELLHMPRSSEQGYFVAARNGDDSLVSPADQQWRWLYVQPQLPRDFTDPRIDLSRDGERIKVMDVNNDHLIDVVRTAGTEIQTWLNLGWLPGGDGRFGSWTSDGEGGFALSTEPIASCLLHGGVPLDFADPEVRIADMNGDGIQDIVKVRRGRVLWWPGRGPGLWGEGDGSCDGFVERGYIDMAGAPPELDFEASTVNLSDVNGDGAPDLVQVRFDGIDVWFNRGGHGFSERVIVAGTPHAPAYAQRVRMTDVDGSGTLDVLYGNAGNYEWIDLMDGVRPRVLTRIDGSLGARTELTYASSVEDYLGDLRDAESCADCEAFTWSQLDGECDQKLLDATGECAYRAGGSPVLPYVVRSHVTSDRFDVLGLPETRVLTRYAYHDAYYEGIEQELRGFGAATVEAVGDETHPTAFARSRFLQGARPSEIASDRLANNPVESLGGRIFLSESFDAQMRYLGTSHSSFTVRHLHDGLDGRFVTYAWAHQSDQLHYDHAPFTPGAGTLSLPSIRGAGDSDRIIAIRGERHAHVRSTSDAVDNVGHALRSTAHGRITGEDGEPLPDENIVSHLEPTNLAGSTTGWLWRTLRQYLTGHGDATPLGDTTNTFDARGNAVTTTTHVTQNNHYAFDGDGAARDYGSPAPEDLRGSTSFDVWGNPFRSCGGGDVETTTDCLSYSLATLDANWAHVPETESIAIRPGVEGFEYLDAAGQWDRGVGAMVRASDANGITARTTYDGLGRATASIPPPITGCAEGRPTIRIEYLLTTDPDALPVSRVRTTTELDCSSALGTNVLEAVGIVDGAGALRATLSTGEDPGANRWVRAGIVRTTARGTAARAYQPVHYAGDETSWAAVLSEPAIAYDSTSYDAFGRPTAAWNACGNRMRTQYHALSTDVCDANDDDPTSPHAGTCTTGRSDGHGRAIDQVLRNRQPGSPTTEYYRLFTTYRADGSVLSVQRAETSDDLPLGLTSLVAGHTVQRTFDVDSVGRRVASTDPDTDGASTWRYLFNRVGDLAAVRDPRGCGQNFFYDHAGRLIGEQYVGCAEAQAGEHAVDDVPVGAVGFDQNDAVESVHVRNWFDEYESSWAGTPTRFEDYPSTSAGVLGRLVGSADRGERSVVAYDARGSAIWSARQLAVISAADAIAATLPGDTPSVVVDDASATSVLYDEAHTYTALSAVDHAGRARASTLPRDPDGSPRIGGTLSFNRRGLVATASAQVVTGAAAATLAEGAIVYAGSAVDPHPIVTDASYTRDGLSEHTMYANGVASSTEYDLCRRPTHTSTTRAPATMPSAERPLAAVSLVADQTLVWDGASNLVSVIDGRDPLEWPAGHRPRTTHVVHDALYRVAGAELDYTQDSGEGSPVDIGNDWRDEMALTRPHDPMRPEPAPMLASAAATRAASLTWEHDWLGNVREWTDDAHSFYERSLGEIANGADTDAALRPSALYLAADLSGPAADRGGWLSVDYGEGGNVVAMTARAQCSDDSGTCSDPGGSLSSRITALEATCSCAAEQHYQYRWDELNRLAEARRYDRAGSGDWQLEARHRYRYDGANQRRVKQVWTPSHGERHALTVMPGDYERRGLLRTATSYESSAALGSESQFLVAGARIVWTNAPVESGLEREHRITLPIADLIGTTGAVVDLESGELVEHSTYYPNGARETYRAHDERVAAELAGFTTKESDEEVGITYFGERYLIPRIGRWASPDPLAIHAVGGGEPLNSYHYVSGNVLQARDPIGLDPNDVVAGLVAEDWGDYDNVSLETTGVIDNSTSSADIVLIKQYDRSDPAVVAPSPPPSAWSGVAVGACQATIICNTLLRHDRVMSADDRVAALTAELDRLDEEFQATVDAILHPIDTAKGIVEVVVNGDDYQRGQLAGSFLPVVVGSVVGPRPGGRVPSPCPNSVAEDTVVLTASGFVPIGEVDVGDLVWSRTEDGTIAAFNEVLEVIDHGIPRPVIGVYVDADGGWERLDITGNHRIFAARRGWIASAELRLGDEIALAEGTARVVGLETRETQRVLNLRVDAYPTYFVGERSIWIHNDCAQHARALNRSMNAAGDVPGYRVNSRGVRVRDDAAHIVASTGTEGAYAASAQSRQYLRNVFGRNWEAGILNSADNGVYLPRTRAAAGERFGVHHGATHTQRFHNAVRDDLMRGPSNPSAVRARLRDIKEQVRAGTYRGLSPDVRSRGNAIRDAVEGPI